MAKYNIKFANDNIEIGQNLYIKDCSINNEGNGTFIGVAASKIYLNDQGIRTIEINGRDRFDLDFILLDECAEA